MALSFSDYSFKIDYDPFGYRDALIFGTTAPPTFTPPKPKPTEFKFKVGDKVNVKIDTTAKVSYVYSDGTYDVDMADGNEFGEISGKHLTLTDPENFPPKAGQVWKADGKLWGVRPNYSLNDAVVVYPIDLNGKSYSKGNLPGNTMDDFKKLRPTLVG